MKILRAEVHEVAMGLRQPYTIAYSTVSSARNVFVQLVTDGPHVGLGVAGPDPDVTGESVADSAQALRAAAPALAGADPRWRRRILAEVAPVLEGNPAAQAALDIALHDLMGKIAGLPVWAMLGGCRSSLTTSATVFMDSAASMIAEAERLAAEGFTAIKVKGGHSPGEDAAILRAIRDRLGDGIRLRFDANQGYTEAEAVDFAALLGPVQLEVFEQPTRRGEAAALHAVAAATASPVMADESLLHLADALRLVRGDLVNMMNIKLMKVGGLDAAEAVAALARSAGMPIMLGCVDESALGIAAGLHFALSRVEEPLADLDGHLDLLNDPGAGAVLLDRGVLRPADGPGFGVARLDGI